jgi:hypothetical protein
MGKDATAATVTVTTDAAGKIGWGGWVRFRKALGDCEEALKYFARDVWSDEDLSLEDVQRSTVFELVGLLRVLQSVQSALPPGSRITARMDNTGSVNQLNNGGGPCWRATMVTRQIWLLACTSGWSLDKAEYIPGKKNIAADGYSRKKESDTWSVKPFFFGVADAKWGPHSMDRFAAPNDHQHGLSFNSRRAAPGSSGVDAFTQDWREHNNWVHPDPDVMGRVLSLIKQQNVSATVVAPNWPTAWWWPLLCAMAQDFLIIPADQKPIRSVKGGNKLFMEPFMTHDTIFVRIGAQERPLPRSAAEMPNVTFQR